MRVVVAEDSVLFREGLVRLLQEKGHDVVAAVADAQALKDAVGEHLPELAIIDVRMPPTMESDGADAAAALRDDYPELGLLLLSQHIELRPVLSLVGTPGFGYLLKDRVLDLADFVAAVERVARGGSALDPEVVRSLVRSTSASALDALSERELDVLRLVAEGHTNTAIAEKLFLSGRTVESHMRSVFSKLGLDDDGSTHRRVLAVVTYLESR
ncbi:MAG: response regulator transcription factor [Nocardioidaceae bacterium]|nr:MAG: response regulator transcription factor [Nocardioidaceae bacterium]